MLESLKPYFLAFVPIFVAVDALGTVPLFMVISHKLTSYQKGQLIKQSMIASLAVALVFLAVGKTIFLILGITFGDFLIAGGIVLFLIALTGLLLPSRDQLISHDSIGVVPLAVPIIVGPAFLATSLILLGSYGLGPTLFSIIMNIFLAGLAFSAADRISKILGEIGSQVFSKIGSLLLAAIAVMLIRRGFFEVVQLWHSIR